MKNPSPAASSPWQEFLGIEFSPVSHREKLISALGGFLSLMVVYAASLAILGASDTLILALSIGSSAVLLFAVPVDTSGTGYQ